MQDILNTAEQKSDIWGNHSLPYHYNSYSDITILKYLKCIYFYTAAN